MSIRRQRSGIVPRRTKKSGSITSLKTYSEFNDSPRAVVLNWMATTSCWLACWLVGRPTVVGWMDGHRRRSRFTGQCGMCFLVAPLDPIRRQFHHRHEISSQPASQRDIHSKAEAAAVSQSTSISPPPRLEMRTYPAWHQHTHT